MQRLLILLLLWAGHTASAQIILSEVMFNPQGNENTNEFLEIFNTSATDSVSLVGWRIGDQTETDLLISPDSLYWLSPNQYAVVLDPGYFQSSTIYDSLIPPQALILTIDDNSFGGGGLSNSTAETIFLVDAVGNPVARYTYSLGNPDGMSDEKILPSLDDSPGNWANSRYLDGTPGRRNSVTPYQIDGKLVAGSWTVSPISLREGQTARISVLLHNAGLQTITGASVEFWITNSSATVNIPSFLGSGNLPFALISGDSARVGIEWENLIAGGHTISALLRLPGDEQSANDTLVTDIAVGWRQGVVRINEIMYEPTKEQPEWIEIFNPQSFPLSLAEWQVQDKSGKRGTIPRPVVVPAWGYLVLAENLAVADLFGIPDSVVIVVPGFPALNDDGDVLLVRDFSDAVIDSVAYQKTWGGSGLAAEKVWYERENEAVNWLPSQDPRGGTPAAFNSVSPREVDLAAARLWFEPPDPHAGADVYLVATVLNRGRRVVDDFTVTFARDRNQDGAIQEDEEISTVTVNRPLPAEDSSAVRWLWPQPSSGRHRILAIATTALDVVPENNRITARLSVGYNSRSVVINEIYYKLQSEEVEWVELYNRTTQPVDLSAWRWRDSEAEGPIVLPDSGFILSPGEFVLLSKGPNIRHADPNVQRIIPRTWLALNDDREQLVLADFHGWQQDSLSFTPRWGGDKGVSLERINPHLRSADSSNWSSCVDPFGSTPGRSNSIFTEFVPRQATLSVSPQPFSPDRDSHDDFAVIQIQVPATTANVHLKIYDVRGRLVRHLLNNAPVGATYEVVWNGKDDAGRLLPMGIYILYLQAIQATGGVLVEARTTLVLARALD
jgi:hypothetical protein